MKPLPTRKPNRLKGYDYGNNGGYFITVCTENRAEISSRIIVGANSVRPHNDIRPHVELSPIGQIVDAEIKILSNTYPNLSVDKYVIMPNHIHIIIIVWEGGRTEFAPTVSRAIKQWKGAITKKAGGSIWQKSFHDRIIRNQAEYNKIADYIDNNPLSWENDCFYTQSTIDENHGDQ